MPNSRPSPADYAAAEQFVRETYDADPALSRRWLATHRAKTVHAIATAEMLKRTDAEQKAANKQCRIADRRAA